LDSAFDRTNCRRSSGHSPRESEAIALTSDFPGRGPNGKKSDAIIPRRAKATICINYQSAPTNRPQHSPPTRHPVTSLLNPCSNAAPTPMKRKKIANRAELCSISFTRNLRTAVRVGTEGEMVLSAVNTSKCHRTFGARRKSRSEHFGCTATSVD
jgi:hypothetical protein